MISIGEDDKQDYENNEDQGDDIDQSLLAIGQHYSLTLMRIRIEEDEDQDQGNDLDENDDKDKDHLPALLARPIKDQNQGG